MRSSQCVAAHVQHVFSWKSLYSASAVDAMFDRLVAVNYHEHITVRVCSRACALTSVRKLSAAVSAWPVSAGASIGSACWLLRSGAVRAPLDVAHRGGDAIRVLLVVNVRAHT
jgi:Cft2 family RNA processing exonuclease